MIKPLDFENVVADIASDISRAYSAFAEWMFGNDQYARDPAWLIEGCFLKVMAAAEALNLPALSRNGVWGIFNPRSDVSCGHRTCQCRALEGRGLGAHR
jgi:hypothetical protein